MLYIYLKFQANGIGGSSYGKINLQCKSSSQMHSNIYINLKVVVLVEHKGADRNFAVMLSKLLGKYMCIRITNKILPGSHISLQEPV